MIDPVEYLASSQESLEIASFHYSMIDNVIRYQHFEGLLFFLKNGQELIY